MNDDSITQYILATFPGVETTTNFGYTFLFYGSDRTLPLASLAASDNEYDRVSNLDRAGVFRLNIGITRDTFRSLFGAKELDISSYDFSALDTLMPHPHYAQQHYICILNPSKTNSEKLKALLAEAYDLALTRGTKRRKSTG